MQFAQQTRRRLQSESELDEILLMCALDGKTVVEEEVEVEVRKREEVLQNEVSALPQWRSLAALIVCRLAVT
jgi:hypothetical protein